MVVPAVDERDSNRRAPERPDRFQASETRADHDDVWFRLGPAVATHRVLHEALFSALAADSFTPAAAVRGRQFADRKLAGLRPAASLQPSALAG
jgi:hypothetical protein